MTANPAQIAQIVAGQKAKGHQGACHCYACLLAFQKWINEQRETSDRAVRRHIQGEG